MNLIRTFTSAQPSLVSLVAKLRQETGQSFALCRKALETSSMNLEDARIQLAKLVQTQAESTQLQSIAQRQGAIGLLPLTSHSYGLIELRCVSDFVARNPLFVGLATNIIHSLKDTSASELTSEEAVNGFLQTSGLHQKLLDIVGKLKEPISVIRIIKVEAEDDEVIGTYVHQPHSPGFGSVGAVATIKSTSSNKTFADNIAKHIAGMNPNSIFELLDQEYLFNPSLTVRDFIEEKVGDNTELFVRDFKRFSL